MTAFGNQAEAIGTPARDREKLNPLQGMRVLDLSRGLAGTFCTMMLADLGAEVVHLALTDGRRDPDRPLAGLDRNKTIVRRSVHSAEISDLAANADVVIEDFSSAERRDLGLDPQVFRAVNAAVVVCSLTPFGHSGPLADLPATDITVQAASGSMDITGELGRGPMKMGLPLGEEISGVLGAIGILAELERREVTGKGAVLDMAAFDANLAMLSYMSNIYFTTGESPQRLGSSHPTIFPYNAFKTRDGYVVAAPFTQAFWRKFCMVIGREDLPENPAYRSFSERLKNRPELSRIIDDIFLERTTAEWCELLEKGDVPNGPVNSVADALALDQTRVRQMVVETTGETARPVLGTPFHFDFQGRAEFRPVFEWPREKPNWPGFPARKLESPPRQSAKLEAPLKQIRVLDLTRMLAGPFAGQILADLGADVIKIEEPRIGDPTRRNIPMINGESTYYMAVNRGKRSVVIDLKTAAGRDAFLRLVERSDVVIENFRPGVMKRLGLSYDELRRVKPDIVLLSISGFGQTGPLRDKISFDLVNQAVSGVISTTGEEGRPPVRIGLPVGDLGGGIYGALSILAALRVRRRTGMGCVIDLALHDVLVSLLGPLAQEYLRTGEVPGRGGAAERNFAPSGTFRTSDGTLVLAVQNDLQWKRLADILERPDLATDAAFASNVQRIANRTSLDAQVQDALARRTTDEWMAAMRSAGIPAHPLLTMGQALESPQAAARGMILTYDHPAAGRCRGVGTAIHVDGSLLATLRPPPRHGEHSKEVLGTLAALSDDEIVALQKVQE